MDFDGFTPTGGIRRRTGARKSVLNPETRKKIRER